MKYEKTAIRRALFYRCGGATRCDRSHTNRCRIATKDKDAPNMGLPHDWHGVPLLTQRPCQLEKPGVRRNDLQTDSPNGRMYLNDKSQ